MLTLRGVWFLPWIVPGIFARGAKMRDFDSVEEANAYNVGFLQGVRHADLRIDRPWFVGSERERAAWSEGISEGHAMREQFFGQVRHATPAEPQTAEAAH